MRQPIYEDPDWTLEIDPACSREETSDGFTIFVKPGLNVFAVIYCGQPFDADHVVRRTITSGGTETSTEVSYETLEGGLVGAFSIDRSPSDIFLTGVASSYGDVARISCHFQDESFLAEALAVWRSLRHAPPEYARLCGEADPPLADLRAKLEGELHLEDAIAEIRRLGQTAEAVAVLLAALKCDYHLTRRNACDALRLLDERTTAVVDGLQACLADPSGEIAAWAGDALVELGGSPESVAKAMIEIIIRPEPPPDADATRRRSAGRLWGPDRLQAARVLSYMGEAARPYRETLERYRRDAFGPMRLWIAQIFSNLGEPLDVVTPPLYEAADDVSMELAERSRVADWLLEYCDPTTTTAERLRTIRAEYQEQCDRNCARYDEADAESGDIAPNDRSSDSDRSPTE